MRASYRFLSATAPAPSAPPPMGPDVAPQPFLPSNPFTFTICIVCITCFILFPAYLLYLHIKRGSFASATTTTATATATTATSNPSVRGFKKKKGLTTEELNSLPITSFSMSVATSKLDECAICIEDFARGEELKILPKCNHGFHVECIDSWLKSNPSCPSCRQKVSISSSRLAKRYSVGEILFLLSTRSVSFPF